MRGVLLVVEFYVVFGICIYLFDSCGMVWCIFVMVVDEEDVVKVCMFKRVENVCDDL